MEGEALEEEEVLLFCELGGNEPLISGCTYESLNEHASHRRPWVTLYMVPQVTLLSYRLWQPTWRLSTPLVDTSKDSCQA